MKVKECMTTTPEYISPELSLREAAWRMRENNTGFLPIGENDRLIGVITDRDIATRAVAEGKDPATTPVREIMTRNVFYCYDEDDIELAGESMEKQQVRRLVVLNNKKRLRGILSLGDIATKSHNEHLYGEILEQISETG